MYGPVVASTRVLIAITNMFKGANTCYNWSPLVLKLERVTIPRLNLINISP